MNLLFRFLSVLVASHFRSKVGPLDSSVCHFRVLPSDFDVYRHMNNGRYLSMMDAARLDLIIRLNLLPSLFRRRTYPVVGSAMIRYVRSIDAFRRYSIRTRVLSWDEKWFFIEQLFECDGRVMAVGLIKGLFRGPHGKVAPSEIMALVGGPSEPPALPDHIRLWIESDASMMTSTA